MLSDLLPLDAPETPAPDDHALPTGRPGTPAERVARNFIRKYGRPAFTRLLADFQADESGAITAKRLGVCRERVRQWKEALGVEVRLYTLHPEVQRLVQPSTRPRARVAAPHDGPPAALAEGLAGADLDLDLRAE